MDHFGRETRSVTSKQALALLATRVVELLCVWNLQLGCSFLSCFLLCFSVAVWSACLPFVRRAAPQKFSCFSSPF